MADFITLATENWALLLAIPVGILALYIIVKAIIKFSKLPFATQKAKVKACLLSWVIEAEIELGKETGKAKLSVVYSWFVTAFPVFKNFISLETFSKWVDEALDELQELLKENESLKELVEPENK